MPDYIFRSEDSYKSSLQVMFERDYTFLEKLADEINKRQLSLTIRYNVDCLDWKMRLYESLLSKFGHKVFKKVEKRSSKTRLIVKATCYARFGNGQNVIMKQRYG